MSLELANNIIAEFGRNVGIEGLALDEQGYCCLRFDSLDTHFQYDASTESLVLFTRVGVLEEESLTEGLADMMSANLFWGGTRGATLAYQPGDNFVFLQAKTLVQGIDFRQFEHWISEFVASAEYWEKYLTELNAGKKMSEGSNISPSEHGFITLFA